MGDLERLGHILDSIDFIEKAMLNINEEEFYNDFILHTAVVKQFEIIGEASYQISVEIKKADPAVEWKGMEGLWHVLMHEYFGIDLYKIWDL